MAKTQYASIPELLALLNEFALGRPLRHALCLVSRQFHAAFAPGLYKTFKWNNKNCEFLLDDEKRALLLEIPLLARYTESLVFTAEASRAVRKAVNAQDIQISNALLQVVGKTLNLKKFVCQDVVLTNELVGLLSGREKLERLEIEFPSHVDEFLGFVTDDTGQGIEPEIYEAYFPIFGRPWAHLSSFRNLRYLSIQGISGELSNWRRALVDTFSANPHLEHFGLSMDDAATQRIRNDFGDGYEYAFGYLEAVFKDYARRRTGSQPHDWPPLLRLTTLRVGKWMSLPDLSVLQNVIDLACLQRLHVYNRSTDAWGFGVPWEIINAETMPNLRYFSFECLDDGDLLLPEILSLFNPETGGSHVTGLHIQNTMTSGSVDDVFTGLGRAVEMLWVPSDMMGGELVEPQVLQELTRLTHLSIDVDFWEGGNSLVQNDPFWGRLLQLCTAVGELPELRAVWIRRLDSRRPADVENGVQKVAEASRSLKYLRAGGNSWRVQRLKGNEGDSIRVITTSLSDEEDEIVAPEFFEMFPEVDVGEVIE